MAKLPIGLQLYGLRELLEKTPEQFEAVMEEVKRMGYDGVELAGLYGLAPEAIRDMLRKVGLAPISAHVPLAELLADPLKIARAYKTIGCQFIVIPYLPEAYRPLTEGYEYILKKIAEIGAVMREEGLTLLYHNHDFEFVKLADGTYGLDDIYNRIPRNLLMAEPDTCWIKVAGVDPASYVRKYTDRCPIVHLKDFVMEGKPQNMYQLIGLNQENETQDGGMFEFCAVGFGQQIWEPILSASIEAAAQWVIVEQDEHYELSALECARRSRAYLSILGW